MNLASYFDNGVKIGMVVDDTIWDLQRLYSRYLFEQERIPHADDLAKTLVPSDMAMFIRLNHNRLEYYAEAYEKISADSRYFAEPGMSQPVKKVRLLPPVLAPTRILCAGSSYLEYLVEIPNWPKENWPKDVKISFMKQQKCLIGHGETIHFPGDSTQGDYENELAIIIGRSCSDISEKDASKYIFGYSILNDACIRDIPIWTGGLDSPRGKANDTQAPLGPWIAPQVFMKKSANELNFTTTVDGELRQKGNTSGLSWTIERIVALTSRYFSLSPGDIISTGSTKGNAHVTGKFLKQDQTIVCTMEEVGTLTNKVNYRKFKGVVPPLAAK